MATQEKNPTVAFSAEEVGGAFVRQYYNILCHSPEMSYKFYKDTSVFSCPDVNDIMSSVTTMDSIKDKICSLNYKNCTCEIMSTDAQESYKGGVFVLVKGCLTRKDNHRRMFMQTFFLAPQDIGYFVHNSLFRYAEACEPEQNVGTSTRIENMTEPLSQDPESAHVLNPSNSDHISYPAEGNQNKKNASSGNLLEEERQTNDEEDTMVKAESHLKIKHISAESESTVHVKEDDGPKKSYASCLSRESRKGQTKVYVPTGTLKVATTVTEKLLDDSIPRAPEQAPEASYQTKSSSRTIPGNKGSRYRGKGYSIYVSNLPQNATVYQLETEFKKFGAIKRNGVTVLHDPGFSFAFVEFQDLSSALSAIKASPITIGGHQAEVEMKLSTVRALSGRHCFSPGQGAYRSDSFRGDRNFIGGRGYGRDDFGNRSEFSGRGVHQGGEGYQQLSRKR